MERGLCAALGDFDGVHLGHRAVINAAVNNSLGLIPAVYTFEKNCKGAEMITDSREKAGLLRALGIERIITDDFESVRGLEPVRFVRDVLINRYGIRAVICGEDFRFGKDAVGDSELLTRLGSELGIHIETVATYEENGRKISSSDIRTAISNGDTEGASRMLGHCYTVSGTVLHGKRLASENRTPTVNIRFPENAVIPAYGVYITRTRIDNVEYNSVSNAGVRPSVQDSHLPNLETNIFGFDGDLYGRRISVDFIKMVRREQRFDSEDALFSQIRRDIEYARLYFDGEKNV